jgi:hypothetical protein
VSGPFFMFCVSGLLFGDTEGVRSRFHLFRSRSCFWRCGGRRVPFSCFVLPDIFSAVPRAPSLVFMFCVPGLVFDGTEGVGSRYHLLRARNRFHRYQGHRVPFSCFALSSTFSAVRRALGLDFICCAPDSFLAVPRGVGSRFHVLHAWTRFRRYRGRQVLFSYFALPDLFLAVLRASCSVFMFCALTRFRRYRGRPVPFSCFSLPDMFSAVSRASGPVFMFCSPGHVFGGTRACLVSFSSFALPDSFSAVPSASGPIFMFYAPGLFFGGTECVESRFHVLCAQTHFRVSQGRRVPFSCFVRRD